MIFHRAFPSPAFLRRTLAPRSLLFDSRSTHGCRIPAQCTLIRYWVSRSRGTADWRRCLALTFPPPTLSVTPAIRGVPLVLPSIRNFRPSCVPRGSSSGGNYFSLLPKHGHSCQFSLIPFSCSALEMWRAGRPSQCPWGGSCEVRPSRKSRSQPPGSVPCTPPCWSRAFLHFIERGEVVYLLKCVSRTALKQ